MCIVIGGFSSAVKAQQVIPVAPGFGTLNDAVTASGADNVIFELERGPDAYYLLDGTISHTGYHLTIVAEDGEGDRPKLVPGIISGGVATRCFQPMGDLTLKGLYLTDIDQEGSIFSDKNIVRVSGEGNRVIIDDCHLNGDHQSFVRFDSHYQKVYITNSILSWSVDNGRGLDRRGNKVDSIVVENCTFYNLISKIMRSGDTGYVKYLKFNHNTFVNVGTVLNEYYQIGTLIFTNNLVIDAGFLGESSLATTVSPIMEGIEPVVHEELAGLLTAAGETQTVEFRNNNVFLDPAIVAAHASLNVTGFTVVQRAVFDSVGLALADTTTLISEAITFTNGPLMDTTLSIITTVWEEFNGDSDYQSPFDSGGVMRFGQPGFGTMPWDFSYPTTTASYTAGDGGMPLGDLNWFPELLAVEDRGVQVPEAYRLSQNYPNPFNPATTIQYELPHAASIQLTVYNLLGEEVVRLEYGHQEAGTHTAEWTGRDATGSLVSSGVYFYRLKAEGLTQTRKMLFLR
ncbi:MAG: T9SS type A sorting domain-containing protein [Fidelibacterota bacterium]|nr:MAG: T9SS type A sorting domain-containing protein [Candidatus Neomarinimicrobiota bacterium]